jgi:hypothetical protein
MKKLSLLFILSISVNYFFAQIKVQTNNSVEALKKQLIGDGLEISDFSVKGDFKQVGSFNDPIGIIGLRTGIILVTGEATVAQGPNNNGASYSSSNDIITDPLLDELSNQIGVTYNDAVIVEFDFIPKGNVFSMNFVLGSEEYIEDDESYPDFFGFWITGPGYPTPTNIAKVPSTNEPVSTATINDVKNNNFYNDNGDGTTPLINQFLGFDGYTDLITSKTNVIPCQKYHLKIAIADANDHAKDSGVMIETKSITTQTKAILSLSYESDQNNMFETCANAKITADLDISSPLPLSFTLRYSGTATKNDFISLPTTITINPNSFGSSVTFDAIADGVEEGTEELIVELISPCDTNIVLDKVIIIVNDKLEKKIPDYVFCVEDTTQLQQFDPKKDLVQFSESNLISCQNCSNPYVYLTGNDTVIYQYTDIATGCTDVDTFEIKEFVPILRYSIDTSLYYTVMDLIGKIDSSNMHRFDWNFEDKLLSGNEVVYQAAIKNEDKKCVYVKLIAYQDSLHCQIQKDTTYCWQSVLD